MPPSPPGTVVVTGVGEIDSAPPALSSLSGSRTRPWCLTSGFKLPPRTSGS
jgi:hypothetical protein